MTILPRRIFGIGWTGENTASTTVTRAQSAEFMGGDGTSGTAIDNYREWSVPLEAGTYTFTMIYRKASDGGVITPSIGGSDLTTVDTYNGSSSTNNVHQVTGISVGSKGVTALRLRVASKNASSSAYAQYVQAWELVRTDAGVETADLDFDAKHVDILPWCYGWDATSGGSFQRQYFATYLTGGRAFNDTVNADDGDTYSYYLALAAGTWTVSALWGRNVNHGIFDVTLGGATVATGFDTYGIAANNQFTEWTGVSVGSDGIYELKFTTNGKNASSSDYAFALHWLTAVKTA